MSPLRIGSSLDFSDEDLSRLRGSSRLIAGGRLHFTSHGPLAHLTGAIERSLDSGVDLPRATLYNGALPCNARGLPKASGSGVCRSGFRGSLSPAIPRPLLEGAFFTKGSLIGMGRIESRDGPHPSAEGARHCPSGHGGNREATRIPPNQTPGLRALRDDYTRNWTVFSFEFLRLPG